MSARGHKKKRKKSQATAAMDLACSQQKVNPQAGSELCVASLQGVSVCLDLIYINYWTVAERRMEVIFNYNLPSSVEQ